ncbi:4-hydroxy-tetrahydrodipicolinate reductase [Pseudomonas oryzae]|uniref:4-hydroxy-tetrahydrodipicolinate reductase n=1 Tax=Pseudomonas oryzae TaxID=1392877 RepID=A0A1H1SA71_9PSED|nr:dihydrodipicolinate reductase C-terminal domain-containing protein [Pseudomonas oryzae]SDS44842.1 4-hydroxy-tetrahydrodipicolinate reductase [Pseudomonas oryzae]
MKVGLIGFGRTGKSVATVLLHSSDTTLEWVLRGSANPQRRSAAQYLDIDSDNPAMIYGRDEIAMAELLERHPVDVIIDFSSADGLDLYAELAGERRIAVISAISQYPQARIDQLQAIGERTRVLWSPNITLGINFLILAAKILKQIAPEADIEIIEEHFAAKPETSGTAKVIAENLDKPAEEIKSIRAGGIVGRHEILFGFPYQTVRLSHESIAREAFGNGVLFAARNLLQRGPGFYNMQDLLEPYVFERAASA